MSNALEIGKQLVALCNQGKAHEVVEKFYHPNMVSVEAMEGPAGGRETKGIEGIKKKHEWWYANHEVHSDTSEGPYPSGDGKRFVVHFTMDVTSKENNQRFTMKEIGLYDVEGDKIVREEFFYHMG